MKLVLVISVLLFSILAISQNSESDILGVWHTELKDAKIEIYKKNNLYHGKIIWLEAPLDDNGKPIVDEKNPDEALKGRKIMGMVLLKNLKFADNEWSGGEIYDPKSGDTYTCKMWFEGTDLKLRGYLGWFYDTKTWTKA